jgi:hypothetical protein
VAIHASRVIGSKSQTFSNPHGELVINAVALGAKCVVG